MNDVKDFGTYTVKGVKGFMGREGAGFNCNLYRGGKKVGHCIDDASGGGMYPIDWDAKVDRKVEQTLLDRHIKSLPTVESDLCAEGLDIDEGWFVTELVTKWEAERDLRKYERRCKTNTLFSTNECSNGQFYILKKAFCVKLGVNLRKKYGQDIEIFNELFDQGKLPKMLAHLVQV
jgi:hypothetical protein